MIEQVVILALEPWVRLLLNLKHNVTSKNTWHLITFATEFNLVPALHTTVNVDMKDLALDNSLLAHAPFASVTVANGLSFALAVRTDGLEALDHGSHLAHHSLHTRTVAASACSDRTLFATTSLTSRADDGLLEGQLGDFASVDIFERDLVNMVDCSGLLC